MKHDITIDCSSQEEDVLREHNQCIAFHEAGYATAIYLNNKVGNIPPAFFQLTLKDLIGKLEEDQKVYNTTHDNSNSSINEGQKIKLLSSYIDSLVHMPSCNSDVTMPLVYDSMIAEADFINLLIGSLAEAKHIADIDNELFNKHLVSLNALKNYGGNSDLVVVITRYIQSFSVCQEQQDAKLQELFSIAFNFINDRANWTSIKKLAGYILNSNIKIISSEEIALLINQSQGGGDKPSAILFVDDEAYVLNALRRLFHDERYVTYFAGSGAEGLEILQQHAIDLIISDMRMPKMSGAEFFTQVVMNWPDTIRILLTGYSDMQSTINAVNMGRIYYYCNKPWNDEDLKLLVRNALEQKAAARKK